MSEEIFSTDFADASSLSGFEWTRDPQKVEFGVEGGKGIKVYMVSHFKLDKRYGFKMLLIMVYCYFFRLTILMPPTSIFTAIFLFV